MKRKNKIKSTVNDLDTMVVVSVKNKRSGLNIFLFSCLIFIFFSIYFLLFYFQNQDQSQSDKITIKIIDGRLYFISSFHFILLFFSFSFLIFYFQNNSGQGLSVTLLHQSQIDSIVTRLITGLGKRKQKVLEQSDVIQHGQHMLTSCYTHGHLGQGAQQLARTMGSSI